MKIIYNAAFYFALIFCFVHGANAFVRNIHDKPKDLNPNKLSPVIFIPGDGGSQVEAKLDKPETLHYYCEKKSDFFNIWLNPKLLVPLVIDCWIDNVKLIYDNVTRTTRNMPGVTLRIPGFGQSDVVEWLDPSWSSKLAGAYFKDIGNALVAKGYVRNVTLRGAPYDFRKAPNENQQWFVDLKGLVEETYELGGQQRITLLVHSMGGPMSLVFLQNQTQVWKDKYIERIISLSGAWAGSAKAIKVFAIGDDLGSFALKGSTMRAEQITSPSLSWLMPSPHFWKPSEVLVSTPTKQYTMSNIEEFFTDINYQTGWEMRKDTLPYTDFTAPGVEVHCLYGEGLPTVERLNYKGDFSTTPVLVTGDGDGTVNKRSLASCERWAGTKAQGAKTIHSIEVPNADHMGILSDKRVVKYVQNILFGPDHNDVHESNYNDYLNGIYSKQIPGVGGNKLSAKLNKPSVVNYICDKTSDWYDIWLNPLQFLPYFIDCWVDNMKLTYDNVTRSTRSAPGVQIKVPGWLGTDTMEWVDTTPVIDNYDFGAYFTFIIETLVHHGYVRQESLFGAPYDFRRGPNENKDWFLRLKDLVVLAYSCNANTRVIFICHSMGGRMLLRFLQQMPTAWKDQYVDKIITISTPWGGSVQSLQAISVGYDFGAKVIENDRMMHVQRSSPSVVWLLPSDNFWKPNEVLANTKTKNYTMQDIDEFFHDIDNPNGIEMRKDLADYHDFTAPGVEVHCLYGISFGDTVERLDFGDVINPNPNLIKGNGDGTVNERSLVGCRHWQNTAAQGNHTIYVQPFSNVEHYNTLSDHRIINYILNQTIGREKGFTPKKPEAAKDLMKIRIF